VHFDYNLTSGDIAFTDMLSSFKTALDIVAVPVPKSDMPNGAITGFPLIKAVSIPGNFLHFERSSLECYSERYTKVNSFKIKKLTLANSLQDNELH
jgi:hypothetical protein